MTAITIQQRDLYSALSNVEENSIEFACGVLAVIGRSELATQLDFASRAHIAARAAFEAAYPKIFSGDLMADLEAESLRGDTKSSEYEAMLMAHQSLTALIKQVRDLRDELCAGYEPNWI